MVNALHALTEFVMGVCWQRGGLVSGTAASVIALDLSVVGSVGLALVVVFLLWDLLNGKTASSLLVAVKAVAGNHGQNAAAVCLELSIPLAL